tara:strand:- start:1854 stop:2033 length:180 start_codon:yes stop_codon:yes gene_type:complete
MSKTQLIHDLNILENELENAHVKLNVADLRGIPKDLVKAEIKGIKCKITKTQNLLGKIK